MSYTLTVRPLRDLARGEVRVEEESGCDDAKSGCTPAFVFSSEGQEEFCIALTHLAFCQKMQCRALRSKVMVSILSKLRWLMDEDSLLGCNIVQPQLYGIRSVIMRRSDFAVVAGHLAKCSSDNCAQLRRALLLSIRDEIRMV